MGVYCNGMTLNGPVREMTAMLRLSREATVEYMAILVKRRLLNCQNIDRESVRIHSKTCLSDGQLLPCLCPFRSRLGSYRNYNNLSVERLASFRGSSI